MKYILLFLLFLSFSIKAQKTLNETQSTRSESKFHLEIGSKILLRKIINPNYELATINLVPRFSLSYFKNNKIHTFGTEGIEGVFYKLQSFPNQRNNIFNFFFNYSSSISYLTADRINEMLFTNGDAQLEIFWENCIGYGFEFRITDKFSLINNLAIGVSMNNFNFGPAGNVNLGIRYAIN